jgi:hypothetical protein
MNNLTNHFTFRHTNSTIYYPQGNGQVESTNKVFGTLLTKLMNENRNDWDEHMSIILFSYQTTYKVETGHTSFKLMYGLHPLLPTKCMLPSKLDENKDPQPVRVLTNQLSKLKKLQENILIAQDLVACNQWSISLWSHN